MTLLRRYLKSLLKRTKVEQKMSDSILKNEYNIELPDSNYHTDKAYLKVYVNANLSQDNKHQIDHEKCIGCKGCIKQCQVNAIS